LNVQQPRRLVEERAEQNLLAIGQEGRPVGRGWVSREAFQLFARFEIPQPQGPSTVARRRGCLLPVRGKGNAEGRWMTQGVDQFARGRFKKSHRPIVTGGDQATPIGRKSDSVNCCGVRLIAEDLKSDVERLHEPRGTPSDLEVSTGCNSLAQGGSG